MAGVRPLELAEGVDPPAADEYEISVFGRGVGECIVAHLGDGEWLVVDSFQTPRAVGADPVALSYLAALGVTADAIKLIVATHWDDDHIRGLSRILDLASNANFATSRALRRKEAIAFFQQHQQRTVGGSYTSGVREFVRILDRLRERDTHPTWAIQDRLVARVGHAEVSALAPSDATLDLALVALLGAVPAMPPVGTSVRQVTPNNTSVVLWLDVSSHRVLLGADLESSDDASLGWKAVLDALVPDGETASVFKIAHHGSDDADEPEVWNRLLDRDPSCVMTPYTRLHEPLPKAADIERLLARTADTLLAGRPSPRRHPPPLVRRMVAAATRSGIRPVSGPIGQVRYRGRPGDVWMVECFGAAAELGPDVLAN